MRDLWKPPYHSSLECSGREAGHVGEPHGRIGEELWACTGRSEHSALCASPTSDALPRSAPALGSSQTVKRACRRPFNAGPLAPDHLALLSAPAERLRLRAVLYSKAELGSGVLLTHPV